MVDNAGCVRWIVLKPTHLQVIYSDKFGHPVAYESHGMSVEGFQNLPLRMGRMLKIYSLGSAPCPTDRQIWSKSVRNFWGEVVSYVWNDFIFVEKWRILTSLIVRTTFYFIKQG